MKINISTFNVRGLKDIYKRETLLNDFIKNKIDVLAIQETHQKDIEHLTYHRKDNKYELYISECGNSHHGVGFLVKSEYNPIFRKI